ncbi:MAG TPA: hypothetical protein ENJ33_00800 [Thiothrix sp.]|nr:hypothetical protein [Thiothrix sp.]
MKKINAKWTFFYATFIALSPAYANDISGNISLEGRYFSQDALHTGQEDGGFSLSLQPEFRHRWDNDHKAFTFIPFYRWDDKDKERTHGDIRQLDLTVAKGDWEFQAGISKVFWGVAESQHLVDIINQNDSIENLDGEDKLGQPMLRASRIMDNGSLSLYILPYFRERTFAGVKGRLRTPLVVDTDQTTYESNNEEEHVDYALRWNQTFDAIDIGLSWVDGTSREPELRVNNTSTALNPHYAQIQQVGLDLQYTGEAWLWKLEAIRRESNTTGYNAAVGGFEYTLSGVAESAADLGLLAEYHVDSRDEQATSPLQNDIFLGTRLALNDTQSSELLAGAMVDIDNQSKSLRLEASRRLGDNIKINLEAQIFMDIDSNDLLNALRHDDYLLVEFQRFF